MSNTSCWLFGGFEPLKDFKKVFRISQSRWLMWKNCWEKFRQGVVCESVGVGFRESLGSSLFSISGPHTIFVIASSFYPKS